MCIVIRKEPPLELTAEELRRYREAYDRMCSYHVSPPDFESWVRQQVETRSQAATGLLPLMLALVDVFLTANQRYFRCVTWIVQPNLCWRGYLGL